MEQRVSSIWEMIASPALTQHRSPLAFAMGRDLEGRDVVGDLAKLPHLLIAGGTSDSLSFLHTLIASLLCRTSPQEVRLIIAAPSTADFDIYSKSPHLLIPVVNDPKKAAETLRWAVTEMMDRYRSFGETGTENLSDYNALSERTKEREKLPSVVIVLDGLAGLMRVAAKEVEGSICRVAQMGRASGIHLAIAAGQPSVETVTGLIKACIPSRIAFAVASPMESRIILDTIGAEKLTDPEEMLYFPLGSRRPQRVRGCFLSEEEIAVVASSFESGREVQKDSENNGNCCLSDDGAVQSSS